MVQGRAGSGNVVPLMVRVPEGLRDRIKAAAEANGRSQNSEIVATLEEKYPAPSLAEFEEASALTMKDGLTRRARLFNEWVTIRKERGGLMVYHDDTQPGEP
ncbi:Arc family DNA-binding protein [Paracoccus sp. P2]|uniref:Arc family DNA-binding protein n=1 Tax=Paracoccus sp. P2 TaxID=3248840 RepID=UPI00391F778D